MPKILGNQVLQLKEIPKGELSFLTRNSKRLYVSKAKNLIGYVWLVKLKSLIHGDQVLHGTMQAFTQLFHLAMASSSEWHYSVAVK